MPEFKPAVDVHPLIRAARWGFLIAGIFYGFNKRLFFAHREVKIREEALRKKEIRDAEIAEEKRVQSEKDMEIIGRICMPEAYPPACPEGQMRIPDSCPPVKEETNAECRAEGEETLKEINEKEQLDDTSL